MPLKRAVTEFGKTYKDRFALRTYPGTSVPIFIFILGWSRTKPRVTLSAQTMIKQATHLMAHQGIAASPRRALSRLEREANSHERVLRPAVFGKSARAHM